MVKAIIFDMDGTLADSIPFHRESWVLFLKKHQIHLDPEQFQSQNHGNIQEMIKRFFGNDISDEKLAELGEEKEIIYRDIYREHLREIPGLTNFLNLLKSHGIRMALATMGDSNNIDFFLNGLKVFSFFEIISGGLEISKGKPDPEIFNLSLKKLNLKPDDCVVIEDSIDGVLAARRAGIRVIGITTSHSSSELRELGCFYTVSDFQEFDLKTIL